MKNPYLHKERAQNKRGTMKPTFSNRSKNIKLSPTLALNAKAKMLRAQGEDIIGLSVGEPDFDTPEHIKEAAIKAIREGKTKYTPASGTPSLKQAVQEKFARENNLQYETNQILISCGAKHSIFNFCMAALNAKDEVIIPSPYWVSYPDMVKAAEAQPVFIKTSTKNHYKITAEQLEAAITNKTRAIILNSPSNPSGISYTHTELKQLAKILKNHPQIWIITDDIYEHILWRDEPFTNILMVCPELYDQTIVINGVSKAYSMTGWRIGYAAAPEQLIQTMTKIQSQSTSGPCSISQTAAEAALRGDQTFIKKLTAVFKERHDLIYNELRTIKDIDIIPSEGTFYTFPNMQTIIKRSRTIKTDIEFSEYLLNKSGVAVVPGTFMGQPGAIRISFAVNTDILKDAINRIKNTIDQI